MQPVLLELDRDMEEAAASLGAAPVRRPSAGSSCRTCCRPSCPAAALAFARAIGEFGSVVLISGNIPFKTQVASVLIFGRIESDNQDAAAAVSVVLLVLALTVLVLITSSSAGGRAMITKSRTALHGARLSDRCSCWCRSR